MSTSRQPLIHSETIVLRAPTQIWSAADGSIGHAAIHGVYFSDVRLLSRARIRVGGEVGERIQAATSGADSVTFVALQRHLDDRMPDPRVRTLHTRTATTTGVVETLVIGSSLADPIVTEVTVTLRADLTDIDQIKSGCRLEAARTSRHDRRLDPRLGHRVHPRAADRSGCRDHRPAVR